MKDSDIILRLLGTIAAAVIAFSIFWLSLVVYYGLTGQYMNFGG